jgi:hypothetical protein
MLVSDQSFRDKFNFRDTSIDIAEYLSTASLEVEAWVGADVYSDAERLTDGDSATTPMDVRRAYRLKLAETYLAMYYAYPALSVQIESGVIVLSDRSEGETIRQFNKPQDIRSGANAFLQMAEEAAGPYLLSAESYRDETQDEPYSGVVRTSVFG